MNQSKRQENYTKLRMRQALPLDDKIGLTRKRVRDWYQHWMGNVYIALSGGKDSCVMADIIWKDYPDVPAVFADTGNELNSVLEHIQSMIDAGKPIVVVKPKMQFEEVVEKYGYPVISKRMSDYINRVKRTKSQAVKDRHMKGQNSDGTPSKMSKISDKWQHLVEADISVTNKCCGILKDDPTSEYRKATGRKAFVGTMAADSMNREVSYINSGGCNAFNQKDPTSRPIMFWTEQDILRYVKENYLRVPMAYYGTRHGVPTLMKENQDGTLELLGDKRTGCKFCLFGVHLEKGENRIQRLARVEPESYAHAIEDLHYDKVMDLLGVDWLPVEDEENN